MALLLMNQGRTNFLTSDTSSARIAVGHGSCATLLAESKGGAGIVMTRLNVHGDLVAADMSCVSRTGLPCQKSTIMGRPNGKRINGGFMGISRVNEPYTVPENSER
jgi:hypothetical protein